MTVWWVGRWGAGRGGDGEEVCGGGEGSDSLVGGAVGSRGVQVYNSLQNFIRRWEGRGVASLPVYKGLC